MCGRYSLYTTNPDYLSDRFQLAEKPADLHENYNVAPGQMLPVIVQGEDGKRRVETMKWGLIPFWSKDPKIGYKLINARAETIFDKPMWRNVVLHKRCLIPANGFYEWKKLDVAGKPEKQPFYIHPKENELFAFAGVWETWHDAEGKELKTYSILTTEPNKEMDPIHNRMPVILTQEDEAGWLDAGDDRDAIEPYLHPYHDGGLDMFEVSKAVNVATNNDHKLIYPINSQ
jgi:putative SOS response-associated peptidase YedK